MCGSLGVGSGWDVCGCLCGCGSLCVAGTDHKWIWSDTPGLPRLHCCSVNLDGHHSSRTRP